MKIKSVLLMVALLTLGFILGMLTSGHLMNKRVHQINKTRTADGLEKRIFKIIDADEVQIQRLRPIISPYAMRLEQIRKESFRQIRPVMDSLELSLIPELSEKQKELLSKKLHRLRPPKNGKKKSNRLKGD